MVLQLIFSVLAIGMTALLFFIEFKSIRFQSSATYMVYIWFMLMFIFWAIFFSLKGLQRLAVIIPMGIVSIVIPIVAVLKADAPLIAREHVKIHHLKNDDRVAVTYYFTDAASINCSHFLAESYLSGTLYKRVSPNYPMNFDSGDPNLGKYELPAQYDKDDKPYLFIVEDESLLVDTQNGVCIKVNKKDNW